MLSQVTTGLEQPLDFAGTQDRLTAHSVGMPAAPPVPVNQRKEIRIESEGGKNKGGNYRPSSFTIKEETKAKPPDMPHQVTEAGGGCDNDQTFMKE